MRSRPTPSAPAAVPARAVLALALLVLLIAGAELARAHLVASPGPGPGAGVETAAARPGGLGPAGGPSPGRDARTADVEPSGPSDGSSAGGAERAPGAGPAGEPSPPARPIAVRAPAVGVDAPVVPVGTTAQNRLEVPADPQRVGWWTGRAAPGAPGPAVLAGHVDSADGPGALWELWELAPGDEVVTEAADGARHRWVVERVAQHAKDAFPTDAVYGPTDAPTLRLITCSGAFDPQARSYEDNTIAFLSLAEASASGGAG